VLPSCATSRGRSPIRHLGTRVAAVVPRQVSLSLTRADNHTPFFSSLAELKTSKTPDSIQC